MIVTDATRHYLKDKHTIRNLKEIRCVVLGSYEPGGGDEPMPFTFLVGHKGNIIQTLPMNRFARNPSSLLVGVFGRGEPKPAQMAGVAKLCAIVHNRAPRIFRLQNLDWSKETLEGLKWQVNELVQGTEPRPMAAFGVKVI